MRCFLLTAALGLTVMFAAPDRTRAADAPTGYRSHAPVRPLPTPSQRPLDKGPALYVDPAKGDDAHAGSQDKPWKTLAHAVKQLKPGDTLYLRGGIYYEHVTVTCRGTADKPITIRAYPGELAILDGGLREFFEKPATAWEPCPDGVADEYRSTKAYPDLGATEKSVNVRGHFGDSMVPMQGYRFPGDLRDPSMIWDLKNKVGDEGSVYCGPGVWYDVKTGRIHARLAHTNLKALHDDNYRGATDPRQVPLVIAGLKSGPVLAVRNASDLRFQDLVVRGSVTATVDVTDSARLIFDGLTVYSGQSAFGVRDTAGFRLLNTACRGIAAPWTFRGHLKYRSTEARIFSASGWSPTGRDNRDFELAYSEFTDSVDGVFIGSVKGVHFHHNLLDNVSDDGIFLTAGTAYDGTTHGGDVHIYQNVLSRCLTTFAFGVGHGRQKALPGKPMAGDTIGNLLDGKETPKTPAIRQTGSGVTIYRNLFDFRRPVMYQFPADPTGAEELPAHGRFASDHGGPTWEPMTIYHNTILADDPGGYDYGAFGFTRGMNGGGKRRVFNNMVVQVHKFPSIALVKAGPDLEMDGNLLWSVADGTKADFVSKFRQSKVFTESKARYAPGWGANDRFADPKLVQLATEWKAPLDLRLQEGSPAIDGGVALPADWTDPLRAADKGKPDIGVIPAGGEPWRVGVGGRLTMFGALKPMPQPPAFEPRPFADLDMPALQTNVKPAAIVEGYPEFDAPILNFALRKQGIPVEIHPRAWLECRDYHKHRLVVIAGDLQRAGIEHRAYTAEDLAEVEKFLNEGGTLCLLRRGKRVFDSTPEGKKMLQALTARPTDSEKDAKLAILEPAHPWVKHLDPKASHPWLTWRPDGDNPPLRAGKGERIIGSPGGACLLYRVPVGKGQLIYLHWQIGESLPGGRTPSTVEQEHIFEEQVRILMNIAADVYPPSARN